jgi:hypothetical protein
VGEGMGVSVGVAVAVGIGVSVAGGRVRTSTSMLCANNGSGVGSGVGLTQAAVARRSRLIIKVYRLVFLFMVHVTEMRPILAIGAIRQIEKQFSYGCQVGNEPLDNESEWVMLPSRSSQCKEIAAPGQFSKTARLVGVR